MGQKIHPLGVRLGFNKTWSAKWFSKKNIPEYIQEDMEIRSYLTKKLYSAGIGNIVIERAGKAIRINIYSARPGLVIGKKGADIETLKAEMEQFSDSKININIIPIKKPELNALIVAEDVAQQLLKRGSYRRILKKSIARTMAGGAQGIKIRVSGRLSGAEIARTEWLKEGRIPLQTLRANIEYGFAESNTNYGKIGVKVWIFIEDDIKKELKEQDMRKPVSDEKIKPEKEAIDNVKKEEIPGVKEEGLKEKVSQVEDKEVKPGDEEEKVKVEVGKKTEEETVIEGKEVKSAEADKAGVSEDNDEKTE